MSLNALLSSLPGMPFLPGLLGQERSALPPLPPLPPVQQASSVDFPHRIVVNCFTSVSVTSLPAIAETQQLWRGIRNAPGMS